MTFKGCTYETVLELHTLIMANESLLTALEKDLQRRRMIRDVDLASAETRVNLQKNFIKELHRLEADLVEKIDKIAYSLSDLEAQLFLKKFIIGLDTTDIQDQMKISSSTYYRLMTQIENKLSDNKDFDGITRTLKNE
jgi:DNA-directed RNA polymerase specialized sigma24 family protein